MDITEVGILGKMPYIAGTAVPDAVVQLNDWWVAADGQQYKAIRGHVGLVENKVGDVRIKTGRGADFAVVIRGNSEVVVVFGCQVRGIQVLPELTAGPREIPPAAAYRVP